MDGLSAVASIIALVQAGGMVLQVGKVFHDTFVSKDFDDKSEAQAARVANIDEFIRAIEFFKHEKGKNLTSTCSTTAQATVADGNTSVPQATSGSGAALDALLDSCRGHLEQLQKKIRKMAAPANASKLKRFIRNIKQAMDSAEVSQIDVAITSLMQELNLFISLQVARLTQQSIERQGANHEQVVSMYQAMETRRQDDSQQSANQQTRLLSELGRALEGLMMDVKTQASAFEQGQDMLLDSLRRLSISPRIERSFSGTTVASETDQIDGEDLIAPLAPGLIRHPGFGFREDRLGDAVIPGSLLKLVNEWISPGEHGRHMLCVRTPCQDDDVHDLCNRVVREIAASGRRLLCYNGLPREGLPPAAGWYTMTHVIWWLSGQLLVPVPHLDGHMPSRGYTPDPEVICERLDNKRGETIYVVFYLLNRSCSSDEDGRLYAQLIHRLAGLAGSTDVRLLVFSDVAEDAATEVLPKESVFRYMRSGKDDIALAEWEVYLGDDGSSSDADDSDDDAMSM